MWQIGSGGNFNMLYRIYLVIFISTVCLYAARPMVNDDARVVDKRSCQLETWGIYDGNIAEYWAIPGCNLFLDIEISMGAMMGNADVTRDGIKGEFKTQQFLFGGKRIFNDLEEQGYSYGIAIGNAYNFLYSKYRNEHFAYIPFSLAFSDNTLLLHTNLGYKLKRNDKEPHIYHFGLGLEKQITRRLWVLGEGIYERLDSAKFQVGLRVWLLQDRIQLDGTYGNAFRGNQSWISIGLRFLSPELF